MAFRSASAPSVIAVLLLGLFPVVAAAQNGYISGQVRDSFTLAPIAGITVEVCSSAGCRQDVTQSQGGYFFALPPATYWVFTNNDIGYTNEIFDNILCEHECSPVDARYSGRLLTVQPTIAWNASFDLDFGARIGGTITDNATSTPLLGVEVQAWADLEGFGTRVATASTSVTGEYALTGLPAGRYFLKTANQLGYLDEIYPNICVQCTSADVLSGQPIDVGIGGLVTGSDLALDLGGRISGTVTDAVTGHGQPGVCVYALTAFPPVATSPAGQNCTDASGAYEVKGLPVASYLLWTQADQSNHISELFDGVHCRGLSCDVTSATRVTVALGAVTAGRNFSLDEGGIVRGTVRDAATSLPIDGAVYIGQRRGSTVALIANAFQSSGTGGFEAKGLPTGTYFAYTAVQGYKNEIFDNLPCAAARCTTDELISAGTAIAVTEGLVTSGVDFALRSDIPPAAPAVPSVKVDGSTVSLWWWQSYDGGSTSSYVLEAGPSPGTTFLSLPTAATSFEAAGVAPGIYYVRVKAVNAFGVSPASDEGVVVVTGGGVSPLPGAPQSLRGWMSGARLTLMWESPVSRAGLVVTGYVVEAGSGPGLRNIAAITVNGRTLTYLPVPDGVYFIRVRAMSASGLSAASNEIIINSGFVPEPPREPWLDRPVVNGSTVALSWQASSRGAAPTSYVVRAGSAPGLSNLAEANVGPGTTATFSGVPRGQYYVRVHGANAAGLGLASNEVLVIVR